jgi:hypothetical protein
MVSDVMAREVNGADFATAFVSMAVADRVCRMTSA